MRLAGLTGLLGAAAIMLAASAAAAQAEDVRVRGRIDLGDFEIIIGDTGDWFDGWDDRDTRVYARVLEGQRTREFYFDSLPAALFVLRERYGAPRILELGVPEFAGDRHLQHGHAGHGLIDGTRAYYVWDYDYHSRGGLPLILAFDNYYDAADELGWRNGEILDFDDLVWELYRWADRDYDRIYWRGWHAERWDTDGWRRAWDRRWDGWDWDRDHGWLKIDVNIGDDDGYDRHDRGRNERGHHNSRGKGHQKARGRGHHK
jgi:hypothetical protein